MGRCRYGICARAMRSASRSPVASSRSNGGNGRVGRPPGCSRRRRCDGVGVGSVHQASTNRGGGCSHSGYRVRAIVKDPRGGPQTARAPTANGGRSRATMAIADRSWPVRQRAHYFAVYGCERPGKTPVCTAVTARFMVRMGSPVRFRRGAPPQTSSSGRVRHPVCRIPESRCPPFGRDLPVRFVRSESVPAACRYHSPMSLAAGSRQDSRSSPNSAGRLGRWSSSGRGGPWPRQRPARRSTTGAKVSMSPSATTR